MIRRPPRSTQGVSSAASDVYKRQEYDRYHGPDSKNDGLFLFYHARWARSDQSPRVRLKNDGLFVHINSMVVTKGENTWRRPRSGDALTLARCDGPDLPARKEGRSGGPRGLWCHPFRPQCSGRRARRRLLSAVPRDVRHEDCLLYTSPSPRDLSTSRMPSSA